MKHLLVALFTVALLASTSVEAQAQTALPICNEDSGLSWLLNTEPDMDKYRVYASNLPIEEGVDNTALILMEVPHEPGEAVNGTISQTLNSTLAEGDKYFRVTALDVSGNESPLSDEASCKYDKKPGIVTGVKIILKLTQ